MAVRRKVSRRRTVARRRKFRKSVRYAGGYPFGKKFYPFKGNKHIVQYRLSGDRRIAVSKKFKLRKSCFGYRKPAKAFVRKVEDVLNRDEPCGRLIDIDPFCIKPVVINTSFYYQTVWDRSTDGSGLGNAAHYNFFTWQNVMMAAAQLYNPGVAVISDTMFNTGQNTGALGVLNDSSKIYVESQQVNFTVRNLTVFAGRIILYTCKPKCSGNFDEASDMWATAIASYLVQANGTGSSNGLNQMFDKPTYYHKFNQFFKVHEEVVQLHPGEQKTFVRYGPCGLYDFTSSRNIQSNVFYDTHIKGRSQCHMFVWQPDMGVTLKSTSPYVQPYGVRGDGTTATIGSGSEAEVAGIAVERAYRCCIRVPSNIAAANRVQVSGRNVWQNSAGVTDIVTTNNDGVTQWTA